MIDFKGNTFLILKIIPPESYPSRDSEALLAFLAGCREEARRDDHPKLASISLGVKHIDPLAVLESIFEPGELHFYLEQPSREYAVAGAEAILDKTVSGKKRFEGAREFARETLAHTIAVGDLHLPFSGPHFYCAFTFFDEPGEESFFPSATIFVPRWQVSRQGGKYAAVANVLVEQDSELEPLARKIWAAHAKFSSFGYASVENSSEIPVREEISVTEAMGEGSFQDAVRTGLERIKAGRYEKIVLARAVDISTKTPLHPLQSLNRLREVYPGCYSFSVGNGRGQSFIGASPERLLRVENNLLETEALAGTVGRGKTAREDARLARSLLESKKDLHEHRVVIDSIVRRLNIFGIEPRVPDQPRLLQLSNVQHLRSPIEAEVPEGIHLLDILAELFPTPAVGGSPREKAIPDIPGIEKFDRGLYAGAIGWFNHRAEGEMVVAIRSALIDGARARLYAGNGIVQGSDPMKEHQETNLKLKALLANLR